MSFVGNFAFGEESDEATAMEHLGFDGADDAIIPRIVEGIGPYGYILADSSLLGFNREQKSGAPALAFTGAVENSVMQGPIKHYLATTRRIAGRVACPPSSPVLR
jgi:hypothetical protein